MAQETRLHCAGLELLAYYCTASCGFFFRQVTNERVKYTWLVTLPVISQLATSSEPAVSGQWLGSSNSGPGLEVCQEELSGSQGTDKGIKDSFE